MMQLDGGHLEQREEGEGEAHLWWCSPRDAGVGRVDDGDVEVSGKKRKKVTTAAVEEADLDAHVQLRLQLHIDEDVDVLIRS